MQDDFINIENAKGMKTEGFPQEGFPQMVYTWVGDAYMLTYREYPFRLHTMSDHDAYAAPTHKRALDWLEQEKGYPWERLALPEPPWYRAARDPLSWARYETPDELIAHILLDIKRKEENVQRT